MVIVAALIISPVAQAQPVHLACDGEMSVLGVAGVGELPEKSTLSVAIDLPAGTVTVSNYEPVQIFGNPDRDTVVFMGKPGSIVGISTGTINRVTGAARIHFLLPEGLYAFSGTCRPAKRLF